MKEVGIIRNIDKQSRIVIPIEIYNCLDLWNKSVSFRYHLDGIFAEFTLNRTDRTIDSAGRLTIPKRMRENLGWNVATVETAGVALEMFFYAEGILLRESFY